MSSLYKTRQSIYYPKHREFTAKTAQEAFKKLMASFHIKNTKDTEFLVETKFFDEKGEKRRSVSDFYKKGGAFIIDIKEVTKGEFETITAQGFRKVTAYPTQGYEIEGSLEHIKGKWLIHAVSDVTFVSDKL